MPRFVNFVNDINEDHLWVMELQEKIILKIKQGAEHFFISYYHHNSLNQTVKPVLAFKLHCGAFSFVTFSRYFVYVSDLYLLP